MAVSESSTGSEEEREQDQAARWVDVRVVRLVYSTHISPFPGADGARHRTKNKFLTHVLVRVTRDGREVAVAWPSAVLMHIALPGEADSGAPADRPERQDEQPKKNDTTRSALSLASLIREATGGSDGDASDDDASGDDNEDEAQDLAAEGPEFHGFDEVEAASTDHAYLDDSGSECDDDFGFDANFLQEYRRSYRYHAGLRALFNMSAPQVQKFQVLAGLGGVGGGSWSPAVSAEEAAAELDSFWRLGRVGRQELRVLRMRVQEAEDYLQGLARMPASSHITVGDDVSDTTFGGQSSDAAETASTPRLRILLVSHDNRLLRSSENQQLSGGAPGGGTGGVLAEEAAEELEIRGEKHQTTVYGTSKNRVRLRTSGARASANGVVKRDTVFRLCNVFIGNSCDPAGEEGKENSAGGRESEDADSAQGPADTRMCMVLPELIVRLDAQAHFGSTRHAVSLGKRARSRASLDVVDVANQNK